MSIISLIAAVDKSLGLGKNNQLLCHLPADLKHFKTLTLGKPIIMGRKTYESIGKPLPNRLNIIISTQCYEKPGITVVHTVDEAIEISKDADEVMIIGGADIYRQTISIADRIYLTRIHHEFDADVYFPEIDYSIWALKSEDKCLSDAHNGHDLSFCIYENQRSKVFAKKTKKNEKSV